jgi:hypothetical protein
VLSRRNPKISPFFPLSFLFENNALKFLVANTATPSGKARIFRCKLGSIHPKRKEKGVGASKHVEGWKLGSIHPKRKEKKRKVQKLGSSVQAKANLAQSKLHLKNHPT